MYFIVIDSGRVNLHHGIFVLLVKHATGVKQNTLPATVRVVYVNQMCRATMAMSQEV